MFTELDRFWSATLVMLRNIFNHVEPFRSTLLRMLSPFDIAKFLEAAESELTPWERKTHMNILDDIFKDNAHIPLMRKLGMEVKIFGFDLEIMEQRLHNPQEYLNKFGTHFSFNVFVVVTSQLSDVDSTPTLLHDFRHKSERHLGPEDMSVDELALHFTAETAGAISILSKWILCAPYLSESLPNAIPGWIPVFNSRPDVNLRAYISTFNGCNSRLLHMDRALMRKVFGFDNNNEFLLNISRLVTTCMILDPKGERSQRLLGRLTMNSITEVYVNAELSAETGCRDLLVVNGVYPGNTAITLELGWGKNVIQQ